MEWPSAISWSSGTVLRFSSAMFTDVVATSERRRTGDGGREAERRRRREAAAGEGATARGSLGVGSRGREWLRAIVEGARAVRERGGLSSCEGIGAAREGQGRGAVPGMQMRGAIVRLTANASETM